MLDASRPAGPRRLALATLLGAGAMACAIGLTVTSAWLISRSSQRPQQSALAVAIVAVQVFALGRGLLRYGERLVAHDAAFRVLERMRVRIYERLEPLAPAGPARVPQRRAARPPGGRRGLDTGSAAARGPGVRDRDHRGPAGGRDRDPDAAVGRGDPAAPPC